MVLELGLGDFSPKQGAQLLWLKVALRLIHLASKFLSPKFHFGSWETGKTGVTDNLSGVCVRTRKGQKCGASPKSFGGI